MSTPDGNPEPKNEPTTEGSSADVAPGDTDSKVHLSYEGAKIPSYVVLIWILFFLWGVIYFLRFIPSSVREWFTRG